MSDPSKSPVGSSSAGVVTDRQSCPQRIVLAHGGGGQLTAELIRRLILPRLGNDVLNRLLDAAVLSAQPGRIALTTDSYVVQPLFFPGGDIGRLAVCGTVNDLAMVGAEPVAICLALILEEGLPGAVLQRVLESISAAAAEAGVIVAAGDTKVVQHGQADGLFITTTGLGCVPQGLELGYGQVRPGDVVLLSGSIAEHGLTVLSQRQQLGFSSELVSDVAPLNRLTGRLLRELDGVRLLRDPTRGGLAGVLAELAEQSGYSVEIEEPALPISPAARAAADLLGLDPLSVANEGKFVAVLAADHADRAIHICRQDPLGRQAALIGRITDAQPPMVQLRTAIGGRRVVQMPYGEQLPRIC